MIAAAAAAAALIIANQPPAPAGEGDNAPASARENGGDAGAAGHGDSDGEGDSSGIGLVLADAGYLSKDNLTASGPDRLIATGKRRKLERTARQAPAAGSSAGSQHDEEQPIAAMTARLATPEGITAYRQRGHIAETPHGHIKHNMGFRQLSVRGKAKASGEWRFACTVHNLFKAITTGHLTAAALAALAG
jgi:hypothetical protein